MHFIDRPTKRQIPENDLAMVKALQIDPRDNVLVALSELAPGDPVTWNGSSFPVADRIPVKHKLAATALETGDEVTMYGVLVGKATQPVARGALLHTHNLVHAARSFGVKNHRGQPSWQGPDVSRWQDRRFRGYRRENGRVGTCNSWIVLPLVFCENRNLKAMENAMARSLGYELSTAYEEFTARLVKAHRSGAPEAELLGLQLAPDKTLPPKDRVFPNVDGIQFLVHEGGCGSDRGDSDALCGLLAGYATHPNVAGVTVFSLGCQHSTASKLEEEIARRDPHFAKPLLIFEQQNHGSEQALMEAAIRETFLGMRKANEWEREDCRLGELCLGVKCGGSDGFSGISANPAIGSVADRIVALGGRVILAEFPELCGVEPELIRRCVDRKSAERFVQLMRRYASRVEAAGSSFSMNPSPGNIADGLITDAMKSAGAAKKGGTSPVVDVLDYPERVRTDGLTLLCTPGNDVESTTAMAGAGATLMLFSTGLGTPTGNPVCPVIKISSNHLLRRKMADLIDHDAGAIIEGKQSVEENAEALLELCVAVASGKPTQSMLLRQNDFIPWKRGVSL